jgi:hypothetical protein
MEIKYRRGVMPNSPFFFHKVTSFPSFSKPHIFLIPLHFSCFVHTWCTHGKRGDIVQLMFARVNVAVFIELRSPSRRTRVSQAHGQLPPPLLSARDTGYS